MARKVKKQTPRRLSRGMWEQDGRLLRGLAMWPAVWFATDCEPKAMLEGREFSKETIKLTKEYLKSIFPKEPFTLNKVAVYLRLVSKNQHIHSFDVDAKMQLDGKPSQFRRTKYHYEDVALLRTMAISLI